MHARSARYSRARGIHSASGSMDSRRGRVLAGLFHCGAQHIRASRAIPRTNLTSKGSRTTHRAHHAGRQQMRQGQRARGDEGGGATISEPAGVQVCGELGQDVCQRRAGLLHGGADDPRTTGRRASGQGAQETTKMQHSLIRAGGSTRSVCAPSSRFCRGQNSRCLGLLSSSRRPLRNALALPGSRRLFPSPALPSGDSLASSRCCSHLRTITPTRRLPSGTLPARQHTSDKLPAFFSATPPPPSLSLSLSLPPPSLSFSCLLTCARFQPLSSSTLFPS